MDETGAYYTEWSKSERKTPIQHNMEFRKMIMMTLYAIQQKRHRCKEQTFGLCGKRQGLDDLREYHWNMYITICDIDPEFKFNVWHRVLRAGALTWNSHGHKCVTHPEPPSHLPPHAIPPGFPSAPALNALSQALDLDWQSISHMIIYMFQCYSLKSPHPCLLPESKSPFFTSVSLLLSCIRVIITIFLNFIYMY